MNQYISEAALTQIWDANGLGQVRSIRPAKRGMNNLATEINGTHVIRFDRLDLDEPCRYLSEQLAYQKLHEVGIPAPEVIALDLSKSICPYHYIILTKIDGVPLIDDWASFTEQQKADAGRAAGRYLAMMHNIPLNGFGRLNFPKTRWIDHIEWFFAEYAPIVLQRGIIDQRIYDRMRACIDNMRPIIDSVTIGRLVHSDYQFENLLHRDGKITGIIDFEWSLSGDPSWDFKLDEQWDSDCPGSASYISEGYASLRALPDDHVLRVSLYKIKFYLDYLDGLSASPDTLHMIPPYYERLMRAIIGVESNL
jgi:aminoglycoside phosphotransferase (APT) family kinase protein